MAAQVRLCLGPCWSHPWEGPLSPHVCPTLWLHPQSTRVLECLSCVIPKVHPQCLLEDAWVLPAHKPVCARLSCPPLYLTLALRPMQELGARLEGNQEGLTSCHSQKTAPAPRTKVGEIQPRKFWKVLEGLPAPTSRCQGPGLPATCGTGRGHGREVTQLENLGDEPTPRIGVTGWTWHFSPFVAVCGPFEEDEG